MLFTLIGSQCIRRFGKQNFIKHFHNDFCKRNKFIAMSFLAEVLKSAENVEIETVNKKVPELVTKSEELKNKVITYINNIYIFSSKSVQSDLLSKAKKLEDDIEELKKNVDQINKKEISKISYQVTEYATKLEQSLFAVHVVSQIIQIHESLQRIKDLQSEKLYVHAMQESNSILKLIESIPKDEVVDIIFELNASASNKIGDLLFTLKNICFDNIICAETTKNNNQIYTLKFRKINDEFHEALVALSHFKPNITALDNITKFLWNNVFTPIVNSKTSIKVEQENEFVYLSVEVLEATQKEQYKQVFAKLSEVLKFLQENFHYELQENTTTLNYIGRDLRDNLSELLIKNCLSDTIPSSTEGLQKYQEVITDTEELQNKLIASGIFTEDMMSLLEYANKVDILFINKKCQDYKQCAKALMKKDLHDTVEVGIPHDVNNPLKELMSNEFPQCAVSVSTIELLKLAEDIMHKVITGSDVSSGRLYCTVQNIFEMYGNVVSEHHQKLLQTIPQQVALFYNNCMYITHQLTIWKDQYKEKLPSNIAAEPLTFETLALTLKTLANKTFVEYVKQQIKQIEEILKESGLCDTKSLDKLEVNTEKCIRQCLRQQELLKTVWQKVLPYAVYNKTLGTILNSVCTFITNAVVDIEDISSEAAEQLVDVLRVILTRGPKLFTDPNEIGLYVENWNRLKELVMILNSSLVDIHERWADGKGPLALQFKPEEVKQLIRALFQNTEKRAAILSKIHD